MTAAPLRPAETAFRLRPLVFASAYAVATAAAVAADLSLLGEALGSRARAVILLLALCAAPAALAAFWLGRRWIRTRSATTRFVLFALLLALLQILATAFGHGLLQRAYFSAWHDTPFTTLWFFQQFFTFAGAAWVFLIMGVRLLFPLGLVVILLAAWAATRSVRAEPTAIADPAAIEPAAPLC